MKRAIRGLLAACGLAPAAQVDRLAADARDAAARIKLLEERLAHTRADIETWKRRHDETADAAAGWKRAAADADAETERVRTEAERLKSELHRASADGKREQSAAAEWKARTDKLGAEVDDLRGRLEKARARVTEAERAATTAHEHLMAMEVKLDLIEAAIHVLDLRTRDQAVSRPAARDTAVGADV